MRSSDMAGYTAMIGDACIDASVDPCVLMPSDEASVCAIIRRASGLGHTLAVTGGRTSPVAARLSGDVHMSVRRLSTVLEADDGDRIVRAQAGATAAGVDEAARAAGLVLPLDMGSGETATVGGAFLTAAHAFSSPAYGPLAASVIGLKCVTARGDIVSGGGRTVKNVTGYDIPRFLAGTMGAFAVVIELTFAAVSCPETTVVVVARYPNASTAIGAWASVTDATSQVRCVEITATSGCDAAVTLWIAVAGMEELVRARADGIAAALRDGGAASVAMQTYPEFFAARCDAARTVAVPEMVTLTVPPRAGAALLDVMRRTAPHAPCTGHPASGRYHVVLGDDAAQDVLERATAGVGGTEPISWRRIADVGAGALFSAREREIVRALKRELDADSILNRHVRVL